MLCILSAVFQLLALLYVLCTFVILNKDYLLTYLLTYVIPTKWRSYRGYRFCYVTYPMYTVRTTNVKNVGEENLKKRYCISCFCLFFLYHLMMNKVAQRRFFIKRDKNYKRNI